MCTDGTPLGDRALAYGAPLALAAGADVTLLGIVKSESVEPEVRAALERARALFPKPVEEKIRWGRAVNEILAEAGSGDYAFMIMGSRGRRGWQRLAFGSVAARLIRYSPIPVLIVKGERTPVRRLLACTSGDVRGERVARWGGQMARWLGAEFTVLHVMSQIALSPQSNLEELTETAEEAIARHTREGAHLERELELARAQGVTGQAAHPKLRHGLVLDEVLAETAEGDYDMVMIGGHQAPDLPGTWNELKGFLLADVADQIVLALKCPVFVVKGN
jgi:nucleotide-binding universal stress UspA family protein